MTLPKEAWDNNDNVPHFHKDFFEHHWHQGTGIIINTTANRQTLHQHLKKFLRYENAQGKGFFFRFWETNSSYDYFSQVSTMPTRAKQLFNIDSEHWIDCITSYSERMDDCYTIEPNRQALEKINAPRQAFTLSPPEQQALAKAVVRPYAKLIQGNMLAQYPDYFAQQQPSQETIIAILQHMQSYGFKHFTYLQVLVETSLFYGEDFLDKDPTGTLLRIVRNSDSEHSKYQQLMDYWPKYDKALIERDVDNKKANKHPEKDNAL